MRLRFNPSFAEGRYNVRLLQRIQATDAHFGAQRPQNPDRAWVRSDYPQLLLWLHLVERFFAFNNGIGQFSPVTSNSTNSISPAIVAGFDCVAIIDDSPIE